jgi:hypothetical protein
MLHRVEGERLALLLARSTNNCAFTYVFMVADPIRFGTKFLLMLFCGVPY